MADTTSARSTILVVEDDPATLQGLVDILADAGFRVLSAHTFERAQRALKTATPDLLLVDVRLGDFNGMQLIATSPSPVRAIVVSGYVDSALEQDAHQLGAEYLVKPITRELLLATVDRQLRARVPGAATRRWQRKQLASALPTFVNRSPSRLLDVSHGGMRLEIRDCTEDLPVRLIVAVPLSDRLVHVDVVWKVRQASDVWVCGAALNSENSAGTTAWRDLVDAVP
jgi:ActR/RegA family two-component response regulator